MSFDTLKKQREHIMANGLEAVAAIAVMLILDGEELSAIIDKRLEEGYEEYGSKLFDKSIEELLDDVQEEIVDAIIYQARRIGLAKEEMRVAAGAEQ